MKRILLACLVLLGIEAVGQPTNYTWYKQRTRQYSMMLDSALFVPTYNGTPSGFRVGENSARDGAVAIDTANSRFYIYSGGAWVRVANYTDIASTATLRSVLIADQRSLTGNQFFVGDSAGYLIPKRVGSDSSNVAAFGDHAGYGGTSVIWSNFIGYYAGYQATNAFYSNFLGPRSGYQAATAAYSNFLGWKAGEGATDADNSQFFGALTGFQAANASLSNFIGDESGYQATDANNSFFALYRAGYQATNAYESNFFGNEAGRGATSANNSNILGSSAGQYAKNASYSNLFGFGVGRSFSADTIGSNNIIVGTNISLPNASANMINLGGVIFGTGAYSTTTGDPRVTAVTNPQVGIGTNSPAASSILDLTSTSKGFLAPRMTAAQRLAITPATGLMVFDTDSASYFQYSGAAWQNLFGGGGGATYTASNGLTLSTNDFQLGGTLGSNTSITFDGNYLAFPDIASFADTTNWKPVVVNTTGSGGTVGELKKATYWPTGSGGGGSPAGNYGNIQLNRNSAFATPASDSLDYENSGGLKVKNSITARIDVTAKQTYIGTDGSDSYPGIWQGDNATSPATNNASLIRFPTFGTVVNAVSGEWVELRVANDFSTNNVRWDGTGFRVGGAGSAANAMLDVRGSAIVTGRLKLTQGADVASAAGAIALGTDGNTFEITGTAAITLISNTNWQNGSEITLIFTSTATLTDGTANSGTDIGMELAGNANFTGSADDVVTLVLCEIGGTQRWREKSRSVN